MSKWFEVTATQHKTFAVEVENDESIDDAKKNVSSEFWGDFSIDDAFELDCESAIKTCQQCADEILTL